MAKVIMIQGTMSNAGKSFLAAGLCRIFKQDGLRTAPFKSQNMALNSYITKDGLEIGRHLEAQGIDCINISNGSSWNGNANCEPFSYTPGWKKHVAKAFKEALSIPVIATNTIKDPDFAESLLEEGVSDFVALGRSQFADPEFMNKARAGKPESIRKCIGCMYCRERLLSIPGVVPVGGGEAPHILAVSLVGYPSANVINDLGSQGICLSAGSACHRGKASRGYAALGLDKRTAAGVLRLSFGPETTEGDIDALYEALLRHKNTRFSML